MIGIEVTKKTKEPYESKSKTQNGEMSDTQKSWLKRSKTRKNPTTQNQKTQPGKKVIEVGKITLGPAGPPLHKGVFVVLQTVQHFLFSITSTDNDSWIIITPTLAAVIIFNAKQKYIECKKKLQLSSFSFLFFQTQKKQRNKLSSHSEIKNSPFH